MRHKLKSKHPTFWNSPPGFNAAWPCIKYWNAQKRVLDEFEAKIEELQELDITTKAKRHMWEEVFKKAQFPTHNFQAPIVSWINRIRDTPINLKTDPGFNYGLVGTNPIQAGKLTFGIGVTASHPEYDTSLGVNFEFNSRAFTSGFSGDGLTKIDFGTLEYRHFVFHDNSNIVTELKNTWVWGISLSTGYDQLIRIFDKVYPDICIEPFDPMSKLVQYHDHDACGPRGHGARADLAQCLSGWDIKEQVHLDNWKCVATIHGCCYYAYTVYECKAYRAPFDPMSKLVQYHDHNACGPRGDDARADPAQCLAGWYIKEQVDFHNWYCVATINGCCYYAYTVYECKRN
jgi:hypothetical protein